MSLIDNDYFRQLRDKLLAALRGSSLVPPVQANLNDDMATVLRDAHQLLTASFGLQMVTLITANG